jgi:hypothetical protein
MNIIRFIYVDLGPTDKLITDRKRENGLGKNRYHELCQKNLIGK